MCQEKKVEEDLWTLEIVLMNQYDDSKTTLKKAEKNLLQLQERY